MPSTQPPRRPDDAITAGTVAALWRYPVKSCGGEPLHELELDGAGVVGDRRYALVSSGAPAGKPLLTGKERAAMLRYTARTGDGGVVLVSPEGEQLRLGDGEFTSRLEAQLRSGNTLRLSASSTPLTDCRPVSLLSLETLRTLEQQMGEPVDAQRFRSNLLLDLPRTPERALAGALLQLGTAVLRVTEATPRCRMVILAPGSGEPDPRLMRLIDRHHDGRVGMYAAVVRPGRVRRGDAVTVLHRHGGAGIQVAGDLRLPSAVQCVG